MAFVVAAVGCSPQNPPDITEVPTTPEVTVSTSTGSPDPSNTPSSPTQDVQFQLSTAIPEAVSATQPWKIAYVIKALREPYWHRMGKAAQAMATKLSAEVDVYGIDSPQNAEFVEEQIILISELLEQEDYDGLVLGAADSIRLAPIIEKAIAQGISVIAVDTPISSENIETFVGFDNFAAGESMGRWVVEQLGGEGNVLILEGAQHHDNALERHKGFLAGLKTGQIKILASQSANWNTTEAEALTEQWLQQYPEVDAIVSANDQMALGAIAALEASNRDEILVTGFDGSDDALAAIQAKTLGATIDQIPEPQAEIVIQMMISHLEQQNPLPREVFLKSTQLITLDNFP
ncbi:periplasmic binding protein/LacI transcriptional regulator [[Leptolyngbya] sp. PCC 7376]|nr:periplasmic binding protein/LacI transcriptional regulator [[Leptolyngbya] sp. PCC 7376]